MLEIPILQYENGPADGIHGTPNLPDDYLDSLRWVNQFVVVLPAGGVPQELSLAVAANRAPCTACARAGIVVNTDFGDDVLAEIADFLWRYREYHDHPDIGPQHSEAGDFDDWNDFCSLSECE
jgi:hypothetical protein